jgi:Ca-activated chloride channel family protein
MTEVIWLDPWFFAVLPVVALALLWRLRRPRAALPAASLALLDALPRTLRARLVHLPLFCAALGIASLGVALARPVVRDVLPMREAGVDILLLIDISSSMETADMDERGMHRIEAARERALEFARARTADRVALMTFALYPELRCPLTLDQDALAAFLRSVETVRTREEDRTAIGVGLARAVATLEKSEAKSKVVVLLTDGANNVGNIEPGEAAKLAKDAGVRVHTIGLGSDRISTTLLGMQIRDRTDFSAIEEIAAVTGGRFFRAEDAGDLKDVYSAIDAMEKTELEDPRYRTTDRFLLPLLAGAGLLVLALLADLLWIRGTP